MPRTGCEPAGHVSVGMGGSHVSVSPSVGTSPGGQVAVVGGAHGLAPHGPSVGGATTAAGGARTAGGTAGDGLGAGAAAGGGEAGGVAGGADGSGTAVGGAGTGAVGCSSTGAGDAADVDTATPRAALRMLSVPSGPAGIPEQPATRTETPTKIVLTRITSTSLSESED